jgi:molybdate transport system regulatory protein
MVFHHRRMARLTIRIDLAAGSVGPGKIGLQEQVAATGSIRKAATAMKMSYRRAWLLLQALEACFGSPLVETATGGKKGGGARLTEAGVALVARYRRIEDRALRVAAKDISAMEGRAVQMSQVRPTRSR